MNDRQRRSGLIATVVALSLLIGAALGVRALYRLWDTHLVAAECLVGDYAVDNGQASVAAQMTAVVIRRGLPERAAVLAIAAALQESKLRNLDGGDRDSVGVLQQRPSQGWGSVEQIMNIDYATGKFLDQLVKVNDWRRGDLAETIQAVQISADGDAYAKHEGMAQALGDALTGTTPAGISCIFDKPNSAVSATALATTVAAALPVHEPKPDGRTVSVPAATWTTAAWFVANAQRLGIASVGYSGKTWNPKKGWHDDDGAGSGAVIATVWS